MTSYSLCTTHLNMAATVEVSLRSMIAATPKDTQIIVVDAGSTDGSLEILEKFSENDQISLSIEDGCNRGVGRQKALEEAEADTIIQGPDLDEKYTKTFDEFIERYEKLSEKQFLKGKGLNVFDKHKAQELGGFRPVQIYEDRSLWLRFIEEDALAADFSTVYGKPIGYHNSQRTPSQIVRNEFQRGKSAAILSWPFRDFVSRQRLFFLPFVTAGYLEGVLHTRYPDMQEKQDIDWARYRID